MTPHATVRRAVARHRARLRLPLDVGVFVPDGTCKYHPSCSQYAIDALRKHGLVKGSVQGGLAAAPLQPLVEGRRRLRMIADAALIFGISSVLQPIEDAVRWILERFHYDLGLPWAWAIVATTIVVRICLVPLTVKQIHSMQALQAHAPEMKEIQKKYKGDRQKLNEEMMKFYKENNINPAASCLPLLAQLPVFFALYFVLKDFAKQAADRATSAGSGSCRASPTRRRRTGRATCCSRSTPAASSRRRGSCPTTMPKAQRYLMMILPLIFIGVVAHFPAGLVLYWVTTNLWTVGQGLVTRRLVPRTPLGGGRGREGREKPPPTAAGTARARSSRSRSPRRPPQQQSQQPRAVRRKKGGARK